jgi:hypothetical protein
MGQGTRWLWSASLLLAIVGAAWAVNSLLSTGGSVVGPVLFIVLGGLGLNVAWICDDIYRRLERLEGNQPGANAKVETRPAEPGAPADRPRG